VDLPQLAITALFSIAAACWIVAAVAALRMLRHRESGRSRFWYASNGMAFFSGKGFLPEAEPHRRMFLRATLLFFGAIFGGAVLAAVMAG
jgi:hypothetical protein